MKWWQFFLLLGSIFAGMGLGYWAISGKIPFETLDSGWAALLGALVGSLTTAIFTSNQLKEQFKHENELAVTQREHEIEDRNFNLKREAYIEGIKEFNHQGLLKFTGTGDRTLSEEETRRRMSAVTLFTFYAPDEIRTQAAQLMRTFQENVPADEVAKIQFNLRLTNELRALSDALKRNLGL